MCVYIYIYIYIYLYKYSCRHTQQGAAEARWSAQLGTTRASSRFSKTAAFFCKGGHLRHYLSLSLLAWRIVSCCIKVDTKPWHGLAWRDVLCYGTARHGVVRDWRCVANMPLCARTPARVPVHPLADHRPDPSSRRLVNPKEEGSWSWTMGKARNHIGCAHPSILTRHDLFHSVILCMSLKYTIQTHDAASCHASSYLPACRRYGDDGMVDRRDVQITAVSGDGLRRTQREYIYIYIIYI